MSALISFLGGSAFRMVWGEVSSFITARQEHRYELAKMQAQGSLDAAQAERNMAAIKLQADLGVKTIEVSSDAEIGKIEVGAWQSAVEAVGRSTGLKWLDIANGTVRPLLAYLSILVVVIEIAVSGWFLTDWDRELVAAILGIYVADRTLVKRGK